LKIRRHSADYNFFGDTGTGYTLRWGEDLHRNPILAPWPELADISISNYCTKGCDFCYRNSSEAGSFLSTEDYRLILDNFKHPKWGNLFQVALGGGEPLEHPEFIELLRITSEYGVVANFTTNGIHLTPELCTRIKPYVGAVAVSVSSIKDRGDNINYLLQEGIKTNLHYILSEDSIDEAILLLEGKLNHCLEGINGLIFLTYKPQGRGIKDKCLKKDERLLRFMALVNEDHCLARIGFDACFVPMLLRYTDTNVDYIDSCECGFFSIYIDEKLNVKPCSFTNDESFVFNLKDNSFEEIWNYKLAAYREYVTGLSCSIECDKKGYCRGSCVYYKELQLC
jgi:radical SAM protein with 4Fe4S-binding SPASM domain